MAAHCLRSGIIFHVYISLLLTFFIRENICIIFSCFFFSAGGKIPKGKVQVYHNLDPEFFTVALVGVGHEDAGHNSLEYLDEAKENVRVAAGAGAFALRRTGVDHILVEGFNEQVEASAEGACLAVWRYQDYKAKEDQRVIPTLDLYNDPDKYVHNYSINPFQTIDAIWNHV